MAQLKCLAGYCHFADATKCLGSIYHKTRKDHTSERKKITIHNTLAFFDWGWKLRIIGIIPFIWSKVD